MSVPQGDRLRQAAAGLAEWAEEARGHYGIEECGGPGRPSTEWDDIQDGLQGAAADVRDALAAVDRHRVEFARAERALADLERAQEALREIAAWAVGTKPSEIASEALADAREREYRADRFNDDVGVVEPDARERGEDG